MRIYQHDKYIYLISQSSILCVCLSFTSPVSQAEPVWRSRYSVSPVLNTEPVCKITSCCFSCLHSKPVWYKPSFCFSCFTYWTSLVYYVILFLLFYISNQSGILRHSVSLVLHIEPVWYITSFCISCFTVGTQYDDTCDPQVDTCSQAHMVCGAVSNKCECAEPHVYYVDLEACCKYTTRHTTTLQCDTIRFN